jgi:hypothetical protein
MVQHKLMGQWKRVGQTDQTVYGQELRTVIVRAVTMVTKLLRIRRGVVHSCQLGHVGGKHWNGLRSCWEVGPCGGCQRERGEVLSQFVKARGHRERDLQSCRFLTFGLCQQDYNIHQ